jgi:hypothetical protein
MVGQAPPYNWKGKRVMLKSRIHITLMLTLLLAGIVAVSAQTVPPKSDEDKLIAVIESEGASHKDKVDACRGLALIGTGKAVAPLAALLGDEKLSHMARYALEPNPDPAVDAAFRDALDTVKGKPLIGVIGSVGVRRDAKAVPALAKLLHDPQAAGAASRALGDIGNLDAAKALTGAMIAGSTAKHANDRYEGLLRCAERLAAEGQKSEAVGIYDHLLGLPAPHQVRAGALRGAILTRGIKEGVRRRPGETARRYIERKDDGVSLLLKYLQSDDYILFSAAAQTALEMQGRDVTSALMSALSELPADNQILVLWTLGKRGDTTALAAVCPLARSGPKAVRM